MGLSKSISLDAVPFLGTTPPARTQKNKSRQEWSYPEPAAPIGENPGFSQEIFFSALPGFPLKLAPQNAQGKDQGAPVHEDTDY